MVEGGRRILSNVVASQTALHAATGGIVPEVAARAHLRWIVPVLDAGARRRRASAWPDVDAVAVTHGPGLAGSLLVGINFAKTLAWVHDKPLVGVNHLEGHLYAAWLLDPGEADERRAGLPARRADRVGRPHVPRRDARPPDVPAARPDGRRRRRRGVRQGRPAARPAVSRAARRSRARPRPRRATTPRSRGPGSARRYDFSFCGPEDGGAADDRRGSGRRGPADGRRPRRAGRAPVRRRRSPSSRGASRTRSSTCSSTKTIRAAEEIGARSIVLGGGVAANGALRTRLAGEAEARGLPLIVPRPGALHRQRGDDRRGRGAPVRGRRAGRPRPRRAPVAAAGPADGARRRGRDAPAAARIDPAAVRRTLQGRRPPGAPLAVARTSSPTSTSSRRSSPRRRRSRAAACSRSGPGSGS